MKFALEKLSRYWQLRFLAVGAGVALIIYAVLLPDPSSGLHDTSIPSVAAAPRSPIVEANDSQLATRAGLGGRCGSFGSNSGEHQDALVRCES
jgi:hypothetical protein